MTTLNVHWYHASVKMCHSYCMLPSELPFSSSDSSCVFSVKFIHFTGGMTPVPMRPTTINFLIAATSYFAAALPELAPHAKFQIRHPYIWHMRGFGLLRAPIFAFWLLYFALAFCFGIFVFRIDIVAFPPPVKLLIWCFCYLGRGIFWRRPPNKKNTAIKIWTVGILEINWIDCT